MAGRTETVELDVWSDLACPWCYVGKRNLDVGIETFKKAHPGVEVSVRWHAYIIDTGTKKEGEEYVAYNRRRWGGDGWTHQLRRAGQRVCLPFSDWQWWPNTFEAHRLVHLAGTKGLGGQAKDVLFRMSYEEGKNISDRSLLCEAARELGLTGFESYIDSDAGVQEVISDDRRGKRDLGIDGVPYFIVGGSNVALSGAQPPRAFVEALETALSRPK
eukprot:comp6652_c1_seq1/m.2422 comp6652_c1_seq1/g.2422  ORF comp6652_c1_seq1/g.2422 comp6652_c1_seq1/m.2422 type:complete len:216 (-) comp6652_c1_seq1:298-945(-)